MSIYLKDHAYQVFLERKGMISSSELAVLIDVKPSTIRNWKTERRPEYGERTWMQRLAEDLKETSEELEKSIKSGMGKRGGGKEGNTNAVITSEFERIRYDSLDPDELLMINLMHKGARGKAGIEKELDILLVRERRMLKAIESLKDDDLQVENIIEEVGAKYAKKITTRSNKHDLIIRYEEALTRVQHLILKFNKALEDIDVTVKTYRLNKDRTDATLEGKNPSGNAPVIVDSMSNGQV